MNQIPPASDNLFLRCHAAWRSHSTKLTGKLLLLTIIPLVAVIVLLGVAKIQLHADAARNADAIGTELARQIAASVADPLAADDQLSLNIQLAQWKRNPLISHVRLFTAENRLIAEAGSEPGRSKVAPGQGQFDATVHFQEAMVGEVQLHLAAEPFVGPSNNLLWRLFWGVLILILLAGLTAWRLGIGMRQTARDLGLWYGDSGHPAPGSQRRDELGDLARALGKRRIVDLPPEPEPEPETAPPAEKPISHDEETQLEPGDKITAEPSLETESSLIPDQTKAAPAKAVETPEQADHDQEMTATTVAQAEQAPLTEAPSLPAHNAENESQQATPPAITQRESAILAVRLGNQEALRRLPRPRLMAVLERYREQLQRACELYNGHLHTLHDGTSLLVFHAAECRQDELAHALCCGELLRVLGHELQVEIADSGITLHVQLAIGHSVDLGSVSDTDLAARDECLAILDIVQHSRNLLLLDTSLADSDALKQRGVVRRLASQPGIYCIERLKGPYQSMLERQLTHFYHQRPH
ncbi:hypothetical protein [Halopseudomonas salina]|uniref:Histidine kinase n=1 Tax=Halopseudomonas salina TaxID=1323744 RepID=A0ABQ1PPB7_9GAMM|nr:hypothetical protein [Halopseudomonas salina]GGD00618.1 hypothetical protein GCM10007418_19850 [Halopseudomonas salina]